jgi:glutamate racemase
METYKNPEEYAIWFNDSGVGSLVFLYDAYPILNRELKALQAEYTTPSFRLDQLAEMDPRFTLRDKIKCVSEPRAFAKNVLTHSLEQGARSSVLTCNVASMQVDAQMIEYFAVNYPHQTILPVIEESAIALYGASEVDERGVRTIGIFGTSGLIEAGIYQRTIEKIHQLSDNTDQLRIIVCGPDGWADDLDAGALPDELRPQIHAGVAKMLAQGGNGNTIFGLFCTHFPLLEKEIAEAFLTQAGYHVRFLTQGRVIANKIIENVKTDISSCEKYGQVSRRVKPLDIDHIADLPVYSHVAGDLHYVDIFKKVAATIDPELAGRTHFAAAYPDRTKMEPTLPEEHLAPDN